MIENVAFATHDVNSQCDISGSYTRAMDRLKALKRLIEDRFNGKQADFARAIGRSPSLVWQYLNGHRNIGEKFAREVERKLRLKEGWLDAGSVDFDLGGEPYKPGVEPAATGIPPEFNALAAKASPRSYKQLMRIAEAAADGRLSDADIELLKQIAERIAAKE